jgi:hypothetical protein
MEGGRRAGWYLVGEGGLGGGGGEGGGGEEFYI